MEILRLRGAVGVDGGTDDAHFVGGWNKFETAALERTHLDHFVEESVQQTDVDKLYFRSGDEECSRAFYVDTSSGGSGESAVTQGHEFLAARITSTGVFKNFFGFEIQKTQAHGAASENAFQMSAAATAAEIFFWIESDDRVAAFPDAFTGREAAETDAVAERPHADEFVQLALRRGDSCGHDVGIIEKVNVRARESAAQRGGQGGLQGKAFGLLEVGRVLDDAISNDAREPDANSGNLFPVRHFLNLLANAIHDAFRGHGLQRVERLPAFRINADRAEHLVGFHQAHGDMFHYEYTNCPAHCAPTHSTESMIPAIDSSFASC